MPTTKQTIAQWPFERLYVAPFTQKRGFDERSLTYRMVPMEQAATFSEAHKAEVRDTQFPIDLEKAYELGKRLVAKAKE